MTMYPNNSGVAASSINQLNTGKVTTPAQINPYYNTVKDDMRAISEKDYQRFIRFIARENVRESKILEGCEEIIFFGAKKYYPESWKTSDKDFLAACFRHLEKHKSGEMLDKESSLLHIDHAICNLAFIRYQILKDWEYDARRGQI